MNRAFVAIVVLLVLRASAASGQVVFVGIAGSDCSYSTGVADLSARETIVNDKRHWATGFMDGAYAALGMGISRSSMAFTYARLQNYCGQHPDQSLREAMLALVAEDRAKLSAPGPAPSPPPAPTRAPAASGMPQVVYRSPVFRLNPPTWVLWVYSSGDWDVVTSDSIDNPSKAAINLAYFETSTDCQAVGGWLAGLPKGDAVKNLTMSFQCFPSNFDPRTKK